MIDESSLNNDKIESLARQVVLAHLESANLASPYVAKTPDDPTIKLIIEAGVKPEHATQALQLIINGFEKGADAKVDNLMATKKERNQAQRSHQSESRLFDAGYNYGWRADEEPHPRQIEQAKKLKIIAVFTAIMIIITLFVQYFRN